MTNKERFAGIIKRESKHCGFWHGDPNPASVDYLFPAMGVKDDFELGLKLNDTFRWVMPGHLEMWKHPEGKPM